MKRMRWSSLILLIALLGRPTASGQSAVVPVTLSLEDAVARAVEHAPRLAEARARQAAASAAVAARQAVAAPSLVASSGYLRTNHVDEFGIPQPNGSTRILFPDIPDNYRTRAELGVPLLTSGRTRSAVEAARSEVRALEADAKASAADIRLDVSRAYWTLVMARERVKVLDAGLARMSAWVADVQAGVAAGVLPPNDVLSAQAQHARDRVQLIQARGAASAAELDLARLTGLELGQPISVVTPVDQPVRGAAEAVAQPIAVLVTRALESRAERTGLQERQAGLRAAADAALATMRPLVTGVAAVEPSRPNQRFVPRTDAWKTSWDLGINVTWPLWDGGRAKAERAASLAQAQAVGHRLSDLDAQIAVEIRHRLLDLESSRAASEAAAEAVAAATEARRVIGERFNAGVATPADVLSAQNALLQAELELTQISATLRLGEARLLRAIGGM
jgi:outer membrane protein TolC